MRKKAGIIAAAVFCILSVVAFAACAKEQSLAVNEGNEKVVVEIDYGDVRSSRTVKVPWVEDRTALELLQAVAEVKTHPVGQYVFVTAIDGVEGKRGEMAWYYTVDDKSPGKLAYSKVLDGTERVIKWTYKKDVCSWKVDGRPNPTRR